MRAGYESLFRQSANVDVGTPDSASRHDRDTRGQLRDRRGRSRSRAERRPDRAEFDLETLCPLQVQRVCRFSLVIVAAGRTLHRQESFRPLQSASSDRARLEQKFE